MTKIQITGTGAEPETDSIMRSTVPSDNIAKFTSHCIFYTSVTRADCDHLTASIYVTSSGKPALWRNTEWPPRSAVFTNL